MKVSQLLSRPSRWGKGYLAKDSKGRPVGPLDPSAIKFCLDGAIERCYKTDSRRVTRILLNLIEGPSISHFNDAPNRRFRDIRALLKKAKI